MIHSQSKRRVVTKHSWNPRVPCISTVHLRAQPYSTVVSELPSLKARDTKKVLREDIMPVDEYSKIRRTKYYPLRQQLKKLRLVNIGPFGTFTFENYDLIWMQIHEMLFIEKGGESQIQDEVSAYNPLIPQGKDLVGTLMFEIDNPERRAVELHKLGHVEDHVWLLVGNHKINAEPVDPDIERTTPDGKTSSVHFLRFQFTQQQVEDVRKLQKMILSIEHQNYPHSTTLTEATTKEILRDFA